MSRLTDLITQAKAKDPQFGADLDREFKVLSSRLPFGLNFERHRPEAVELPKRAIRKGDKVRVLPERASIKKGDQRLWQTKVIRNTSGGKVADLQLLGAANTETQTAPLDDLVVVAEFRDTIYPGLVSTGSVRRGGNKPFHTVINGENYHVLKALTYTHQGKVDAIYIDPPYNSGAKDWKYNNDYIEKDDLYRHSKWLAMMERRLVLAQQLLNPADSVLIVTIDEKEYLRLGLLLDQLFPEARMQMISSSINPKGSARGKEFYRVDEYIFFLTFGRAVVQDFLVPGLCISKAAEEADDDAVHDAVDDAADTGDNAASAELPDVRWASLLRSGSGAQREESHLKFYPIYVDTKKAKILGCGDPLPLGEHPKNSLANSDVRAVWPTRQDGSEGRWQLKTDSFKSLLEDGHIKIGSISSEKITFYYLMDGQRKKLRSGDLIVTGLDEYGGIQVGYANAAAISGRPKTQWMATSHSATDHGTSLLRKLIPGRSFPFPKSLYAVEDALRFFVGNKKSATILDFFSGSGTTVHAVMRLNRQDDGERQCIAVTNNEVSADEQVALRKKGLRPGDLAWEQYGICDYITKPRIEAAISGKTPDGIPIKGSYSFTDEFPMADGFEENAEFLTLTYETLLSVDHSVAFARIAPLLWLRAGSRGKRIDKLPADGWAVVDTYGLLVDVDAATPFIRAVNKAKDLRLAYIVTDDDRRFQAIARRLPVDVEPVRLYESYLTNFSFANGE